MDAAEISVVLFLIFVGVVSFGAGSLVAAVFAKKRSVAKGLFTLASVTLSGAVMLFVTFFVV